MAVRDVPRLETMIVTATHAWFSNGELTTTESWNRGCTYWRQDGMDLRIEGGYNKLGRRHACAVQFS